MSANDNYSSNASSGVAIDISGVGKRFESGGSTVIALDEANIQVREHEFLVVVGPSGCGKTTLLRMLAGLEETTEGTIDFRIEDSSRPLRSMVFQDQGVFPWMSVVDNTEFGLAVRGVGKKERREVAMDYLQRLGLGAFANMYPRQLSGGMRQRVNLARAFANDPSILLMDEPLASLDEQTKMLVQDDLLRLWQGSGKVVVFVTHSLDEAVVLGDRIAVMTHRPGRIKTVIEVDLPRPRDALEIRNDPKFVEIRAKLWEALRAEVVAADRAN